MYELTAKERRQVCSFEVRSIILSKNGRFITVVVKEQATWYVVHEGKGILALTGTLAEALELFTQI